MTTKQLALTYFIIFLFGVSPVILAVLNEWIGKRLGGVDADGNPPVRWGIAFGERSQSMVVLGWLALLTGPLAMAAALAATYYWFVNPL